MGSEKALQKKQQQVNELVEKINNSVAGVIVDYQGITVSEDTALRKELRENNVDYFVVKNTLLGFAADKTGLEDLKPSLKGSTAIAISNDDVVAPAKILWKFAESKKNCFDVKAGYMEGSVMALDEISSLAKLPSKEELVAKALYGLNAPIAGFVNVLNGTIRGLAIAINAIAEQKGA